MLGQAPNYVRPNNRNKSYRLPDTYILMQDVTLELNKGQ